MEERLQKILAQAGICSRRKAEEYIHAGRVAVNGVTVTKPGMKVDPAAASVTVDGRKIRHEKKLYILLNKPVGYVTTLEDPQGRPIVTDLLTEIKSRVFPVGRLDLNSEGALLLTNDGAMSNKILHPRFEVKKTYEATVRGAPARTALQRLERGITIDGRRTWPAKLKILRRKKGTTTVEVIIHEGKKRQVRKMFQAIGHPVLRLKRTAYGGLRLGSLGRGKYRFLSQTDIQKIFS
jgi:23S rRNA pseudouridine2605 synthase